MNKNENPIIVASQFWQQFRKQFPDYELCMHVINCDKDDLVTACNHFDKLPEDDSDAFEAAKGELRRLMIQPGNSSYIEFEQAPLPMPTKEDLFCLVNKITDDYKKKLDSGHRPENNFEIHC